MGFNRVLSDGGFDGAQVSGRRARVMDQLQKNLNHHPATTTVTLEPTRDGRDRQYVAQLATDILAEGVVDAESAKLILNWWTHPVGYDDQFKFHYVESTGYDCGWHRQPHPEEVEIPFEHFQQRASPDDEYEYYAVSFQEETPVGLFWEITTTRLERILQSKWD